MMEIADRIKNLDQPRRAALALLVDRLGDKSDPEDATVSARLAAYVVPSSSSLDIASVRDWLRDRLPDYQVPNFFVQIDKLPRGANGKLATEQLPPPGPVTSGDDVVAPRSDIEQTLADIWSDLLGIEIVSVHDNFFEVGGDSIVSIQLISRARQAGIGIEPKHFIEHPTIAALAAVAKSTTESPGEEAVTGQIPLTPIQHWFFDMELAAPHHWNQAALYELPEDVDIAALERAVNLCIRRHDALRLRFTRDADRWLQEVVPPSNTKTPFSIVELTCDCEAERLSKRDRHISAIQGGFDLATAPLAHFVLFRFISGDLPQLLIVMHHLVIDVVSWNVMLNDLETAYQFHITGQPVPPATTPFGRWAQESVQAANLPDTETELEYWTATADPSGNDIPVDFEQALPTEASACSVITQLDVEPTSLLLADANTAYNTRPNELLLTALLLSFHKWTGSSDLRLGLERHGRDPINDTIDVSRTVGWFTSYFPVTLNVSSPREPADSIKRVKEQLRGIPRGGLGFGWLQYLHDDQRIVERIRRLPKPQVLFNYSGATADRAGSRLLRLVDRAIASSRDPSNQRSHLLEINATIASGRLEVSWIYSRAVHDRDTIETLARNFQDVLADLIDHCMSPTSGGFTPADFPETDMNQEELDEFLDSID